MENEIIVDKDALEAQERKEKRIAAEIERKTGIVETLKTRQSLTKSRFEIERLQGLIDLQLKGIELLKSELAQQ